jgi:nucleotide-binding universal stress UspA family protein
MQPPGIPTIDLIVVGVDGSRHAHRALVWAMEEAARRDAALDVVCAWHHPLPSPLGFPSGVVHPDELAVAAKELLETEIRKVEAVTPARPRLIRPLAIHGDPAKVLVEHSERADLLVVGARGFGLIAGALLGSVSAYCIHRSPVPVVVVPTPR